MCNYQRKKRRAEKTVILAGYLGRLWQDNFTEVNRVAFPGLNIPKEGSDEPDKSRGMRV